MKGPRGRAGRNALPGASPGNLSSKFGTAPRGTLARTPSTPRGVIPVPTRRNPRCVKSKHCRGPIHGPGPPLAPKPGNRPGAPDAAGPPPHSFSHLLARPAAPRRRRSTTDRAANNPRSRSRGASTGASGARRELQRSTIKTPRCASSSASGSAAGLCTSSGSSRRGCFASDFLRWASSRRRICSMMNGGNIGRLFLGFTVPHRDYPS